MRLNNKNRGFTFIELLITLTVLAISFLPLMNMYTVMIDQSVFTSDLTSARYLAQEEMEKIKNRNLTVQQLKEMGDRWHPPLNEKALVLNKERWRVLRTIEPTEPLTVKVQVFKEAERISRKEPKPVASLITLIEDFHWAITD